MSNTTAHNAGQSRFKVLRGVHPTIIGGETVVEVSEKPKDLKQIHFSNAKGGLRVIAGEAEVRELAKRSAQRLLQLVRA